MSSLQVEPWSRSALRIAARKVKGRHWIPVIRQTEATPHRIGHANGAQIMYNKAQGSTEIEHFLASEGFDTAQFARRLVVRCRILGRDVFQLVNGGGGTGSERHQWRSRG